MLPVLAVAGAVWALARARGLPARTGWLAVAGVWFGALAINVVLPEAHPLRQATGRDPALWLLVGAFGALAGLYARGVAWLRARAPAPEAAGTPAGGGPSGAEQDRHAGHGGLFDPGGPGQTRLKAARVLVIGAGGPGAAALQALAAAGIGTIGVIDDDTAENATPQRQAGHGDGDIGMPKVFPAQAAMAARNPHVTVRPCHRRLTDDIAPELFADHDLILDGGDGFDTRHLVNRVAVAAGKPLVFGALSHREGRLSVFDPARGGPCLQCVYPRTPAPEPAPSRAAAGGPLPDVVGAMMAVEAVKLIADAGRPLRGRMLIYDALAGETRTIALKPRPDCPVCGGAGAGAGAGIAAR